MLQCAAESVPLDSASQDVIYCVYLFHELPLYAQRDVLRECARLLKPGGLLVVTDSVQLGDRDTLGAAIKGFGNLNEPHYAEYVEMDFAEEMKRVGLQPQLKCLQSLTKSVSAVKPCE
jgi:ubiquinone/menaquinone biosynthesis C-methylase UbiE